jgi:hypothetical protein
MSSRDHHIQELKDLDEWLSHISYKKIKDDIPDHPDDVVTDESVIFVQNVPDKYHKQFTIICKAFQELKEEHISLVFRKIPMTMQARPDIWSLLIGQRKYIVLINDHKSNNGITLDDIPFNGQVGIIAHELCHILDYQHKSLWSIIKTGLLYLNQHKKEQYEKSTDYLAVKKGFGLQLHAWSRFALHDAPLNDRYRRIKEKYYLKPEMIKRIMMP